MTGGSIAGVCSGNNTSTSERPRLGVASGRSKFQKARQSVSRRRRSALADNFSAVQSPGKAKVRPILSRTALIFLKFPLDRFLRFFPVVSDISRYLCSLTGVLPFQNSASTGQKYPATARSTAKSDQFEPGSSKDQAPLAVDAIVVLPGLKINAFVLIDDEELARLIEEKYGISMGLGAIVDAEDFKALAFMTRGSMARSGTSTGGR